MVVWALLRWSFNLSSSSGLPLLLLSLKPPPGAPKPPPGPPKPTKTKQKTKQKLNNNTVLVITRSQDLGFVRNLVEMFPRGLPDLSKQLRDQNKRKKYKQNEIQNFEKLFFAIFGPNWRFPDMRGCAIGGFRPVESESEVKN